MKKIIKSIRKIFQKINEDNISEYAAEAAYFTILSFIPFTIFFLTLIKFTNIEKETISIVLKEFVPASINNTILGIIEETYSKTIETISFSIIVAIWAAGKGFFSLNKGMKKIYNIETENNFLLRIKGSIYTFLLIISIVIFLLLIVLGNKIYIFIMSNFHQISKIIYILYNFRMFFSIGLMYFIFLFLYKFISNHQVDKFIHSYGALFASTSWQIISRFFSLYFEFSDNFSNMYGSLSSMILIMLWVYACMYIILLGAEINVIFGIKEINKIN